MSEWIAEYGRLIIMALIGILIMSVIIFMWKYLGFFMNALGDSLMGGNAL